MELTLPKLEKAAKIFEEIKMLDAGIIEIDKIAMLVANGQIVSTIELKIEDEAKRMIDETKASFDGDGSLLAAHRSMISGYLPSWFVSAEREKKNAYTHLLNAELSESLTLELLGVLLHDKQIKRQAAISRLQKLGITI